MLSDEPPYPGDEPHPPRDGALPTLVAMTDTDWLALYLRRRRWLEPVIWLALLAALAAFHIAQVWLEVRRAGQGPALWEIVTWEGSSHLAWAALLPVVMAALRRWPLYVGVWQHHLPWHALAAVVVSP